MEINLFIKKYWILFVLATIGLYDFYTNTSYTSLIGAGFILLFLVLIYNFKNHKSRSQIFGLILIALSVWGLVSTWINEHELRVEPVILNLGIIILGVIMVLNKFQAFINYVGNNKALQILLLIAATVYFYYSILRQPIVGIMEILILAAATILALLIIIPERKN